MVGVIHKGDFAGNREAIADIGRRLELDIDAAILGKAGALIAFGALSNVAAISALEFHLPAEPAIIRSVSTPGVCPAASRGL